MKHTAYLLLGSNEGERLQWLYDGLQGLDKHGLFKALSAVYETAAWGLEEQPAFLNIAVCLETELSPEQLLSAIQAIELALGRQREVKWGQRTLDIDILFYDDLIIDNVELKIPHPFIQERLFALAPLSEIAPSYMHPVLKQDMETLLEICTDTLTVERLDFTEE